MLPSFPWVGLLTLAGAIFVSVTSEFLPTGLLPDMAHDLRVDVATTGLLVTVFAGAVVAATTPLTTLTRRYSRKRLVVLVLLAIAVANLLAAVAPNYGVLVAARLLGGAAHGLFWGVVASYPAYLVSGRQLGRAIALTAAGASAAFVLGVPLGSALGHLLTWRAAFAVIAALVVLLAAVTAAFLPPAQHRVPLATGEIPLPLRKDRSIRGVVMLCVVIVTVATGHNVFYTYIAPWLIDAASVPASAIPMLLFLFGGAGVLGLVLAGVAADRFPTLGFAVMILAMMGAVLALAASAGSFPVVVVAFLVLGMAFGGVPAMLQTRMLRTASPRARGLAGALQVTAFNTGIGVGAMIGAVLVGTAGLGVLPLAELVLLALGLALSFAPHAVRFGARRFALSSD